MQLAFTLCIRGVLALLELLDVCVCVMMRGVKLRNEIAYPSFYVRPADPLHT